MRLREKVCVITGAGRGIGETTAYKFAAEGAKVVVVDINEDDAKSVAQSIKEHGGKASAFICDITDRNQVDKLIAQAADMHSRIDVVVNNAGITADATLSKMKEEQFDAVIDVNLKGIFNVGQRVAKLMNKQNSGVILNASSVVGLYGNFGQTNYAATKWGVIGMTKTWAKELGKNGIRVNAVAPGFISTPMTEQMPEKVLQDMRSRSPLGELGTTEDIASAYMFLASDEAKFITGTVISVDGGVTV